MSRAIGREDDGDELGKEDVKGIEVGVGGCASDELGVVREE